MNVTLIFGKTLLLSFFNFSQTESQKSTSREILCKHNRKKTGKLQVDKLSDDSCMCGVVSCAIADLLMVK